MLFQGNVIIFWDDNLAGDMEYSKRLFRAIAPYRKWWSSQVSIHAGRDDSSWRWRPIADVSSCLWVGVHLPAKHG